MGKNVVFNFVQGSVTFVKIMIVHIILNMLNHCTVLIYLIWKFIYYTIFVQEISPEKYKISWFCQFFDIYSRKEVNIFAMPKNSTARIKKLYC